MGNVRMRAEQINYGASNVKAALDDLDPMDLIALNNRMNKIDAWKDTVKVEEKTGAEVTFTNALALDAVSLSAEIKPIQEGEGDPSPTNIRPISGRTAVVLTDEGGDNLFTIDESKIGKDYGGGISAPRWWQTISLPVGTYIFRYGGTISGTYSQLCFGVADSPLPFSDINAHARFTSLRDDTTKYVSITITNEYPYAFVGAIKSSSTITKADIESLQITLRDTATVTVQLGQTVYGGTLNVTTGVLTVTDAIKTFNGGEDESWNYYGQSGYFNQFDITINEAVNSLNAITNSFEKITTSERNTKTGLVAVDTDKKFRFSFLETDFPTFTGVTPFRTWLASNNIQVCYELATPQTIQLTPEQLQMLKGYNRLSCDGGGDMTVEAYTGAAWGGDTI